MVPNGDLREREREVALPTSRVSLSGGDDVPSDLCAVHIAGLSANFARVHTCSGGFDLNW